MISSTSKRKHIVILGAGPCGMMSAWTLCDYPEVRVTLIEREISTGGLCRTTSRDGYRFDLGGHRFISKNQALLDKVCTLMGDQLLRSTRKSSIFFRGKYYDYPLNFSNLLQNFGPGENAAILASYLKTSISRRRVQERPESLADWLRFRFGDRLYETFFGPYTMKLWGLPADEISHDWAAQRIAELDLKSSLLHLLHLKRDEPRTYARSFYYPLRGIGQIFDCIEKEIVSRGAEILLETRIESIETSKERIHTIRVSQNGSSRTLRPDYVLSTIPVTDLVRYHSRRIREPLEPHLDRLRFRSLKFFNLMLNRKEISDNTWIYIADPGVFISRLQEPKRRSLLSAPPDKTSLMLEIPCNAGDRIWRSREGDLRKRAFSSLNRLGFDLENDMAGAFTTEVEHGYPVYRLHYQHPRKAVLDRLNQVPNLLTCGRQGGFRYIFMDTAMEMGRAAAEFAAGELQTGSPCDAERSERVKRTIQELDSQKEPLEIQSLMAL